MSNTPYLLQADNLTCIREDRILFEDLNFSVHAGDIIQIEGANGTGKTSLLRILSGLSMPYAGHVRFAGEDIHHINEEFNQDLLFLGHLPGVKGEMTSEENLRFYLSLHGLDAELAEQTLEQVNLYGFEDAKAGHLSAGQHRRIALARLWQSNARIWILDEPFTAIDKNGVKKLEQLLLAHAAKGGCVILTTHQDLSLPPEQYQKITLEHSYYGE
ncbi:cytochrome c biogenesis heme-transporting ATPase CcmA [Thalassotalea sp. HSM 43]|uniref:cytochrome c biogenesis heme-transporting ATPase CcmA n=1 Tax=Thalassotalea sp. HSM 43 TaxID=2552945 RepID=UPI00108182E8|nr:cytochrome c biogenesis heme-transporting ATPase CcmA [Thalassotalea sp. HSM 43]QBY04889.1 cytochrome c biogenesis heme-transporting ATPase CcmA [Thalassotalea sp. HSM 43]